MSKKYSEVTDCEIVIKRDSLGNAEVVIEPLNKWEGSWNEVKEDGMMSIEFNISVQTNGYLHALRHIKNKLTQIINNESEILNENVDKDIYFCPVCGSMDVDIQLMGSVGEELSVDYYCYECESNGDIDICDKS